MIIAQLSIAPVGKDVSVSTYVKLVIDSLKKDHIKFETNAMATVIETEDLPALFIAVKKAHNAVISAGAKRVITELKIDDRRDKDATITSKLDALK